MQSCRPILRASQRPTRTGLNWPPTKVGLIIAEHLELGVTDADETITQSVKLLDTKELADAINRLERGFGLRVCEVVRDAA